MSAKEKRAFTLDICAKIRADFDPEDFIEEGMSIQKQEDIRDEIIPPTDVINWVVLRMRHHGFIRP